MAPRRFGGRARRRTSGAPSTQYFYAAEPRFGLTRRYGSPRPEHLSSKEPERAAGYEIEPAETHIQPNGVPDDRRSEVMAGERDRHAPSYPPHRNALPFRNKDTHN
jgi:hypothetical protein